MGAFEGVSKFFGQDLAVIAKKLNYSQANILVLEGKEYELKERYPQIYENIYSCGHHADHRTPMEYAKDLVASWIYEDFIIEELKDNGKFEVELDGADKNREILPNVKTSTNSDYLISNGKIKLKLELMTDYKGYWDKTSKLDLRDFKYKKMRDSKSLLLAVSVASASFYIYDFRNTISATYISAHIPYGLKPAYQLNIPVSKMIKYSKNNLISELAGYF